VLRKKSADSPQECEALISTIRTASFLGFVGCTPKRRGGSLLWTQRQNFRSCLFRCPARLLEQTAAALILGTWDEHGKNNPKASWLITAPKNRH
jgi:hypothetical protein